ncbi:MAG: PspC domain-containing protein [Gammaproteobacteria bacterium]|jgi:phage shock protein PspC (stress-responsive transcriptional regulator)|nr:PspC domain-containing protein [Gammaproteobacteria bacterium]
MINSARPDGALLAGVCSGIARTFNWNVWALRALFLVFLLVKTFWAVLVYAVLALIFHLFEGQIQNRTQSGQGLTSPELSARNERISDLEKRFRELEGQD